mmetsp:Transcript_49520/g.120217  ORF Transcript_49520/g.120217 Transcript_49520/m.120217 type:complete len:541 (-) Transcript_49520:337-1959(-)
MDDNNNNNLTAAEQGVVDLFRNSHGLAVTTSSVPGRRRADSVKIARAAAADGGDGDGDDEWDVPEDVAVFDDATELTIDAGCRSLPETIKYMTKLERITLINCSRDFVIPQNSLKGLTNLLSLSFRNCSVRLIAQFAGLPATENVAINGGGDGDRKFISLKRCELDNDVILPKEQCIRWKNISLVFKDCPAMTIKPFFHFDDVRDVQFLPRSELTNDQERQAFVDDLVEALLALRQRTGEDGRQQCSFLKTVKVFEAGIISNTPLVFTNEQYCDMFCAFYRTFPNVEMYGCGHLEAFFPVLPYVAREGLDMLASRIKAIREEEDISFARNIQTFYIPISFLSTTDGFRTVVGLAEVFQHALEFGRFSREPDNWPRRLDPDYDRVQRSRRQARLREKNKPEVFAAIYSDEYQKLQMKLRFVLNKPYIKIPSVRRRSDGPIHKKEKQEKEKEKGRHTSLSVWPLMMSRCVSRSLKDLDFVRGFVPLGPSKIDEVRNSLTYDLLRRGLAMEDDWYACLQESSSESGQGNPCRRRPEAKRQRTS